MRKFIATFTVAREDAAGKSYLSSFEIHSTAETSKDVWEAVYSRVAELRGRLRYGSVRPVVDGVAAPVAAEAVEVLEPATVLAPCGLPVPVRIADALPIPVVRVDDTKLDVPKWVGNEGYSIYLNGEPTVMEF